MIYLNSWSSRRFSLVVLALLLAMAGLVVLTELGFDIPVFRQIVGFIFLTFVPGLLILRLLRLNNLGAIDTLLYSVGLSIAFVMFLGLFINTLYPLVGISRPISLYPVAATIAFAVLLMGVIAHVRENSRGEPPLPGAPIPWSALLSPPVLFLLLLPVLSIMGTFWVYFHYGNVPLLVLLSLIALTAVLVVLGKFIPDELYPFAVVAIGLALLWHVSLLTFYLPGSDMYREYLRLDSVLSSGLWYSGTLSNLNAMLSIVMLTPIYSLVLHLDPVWIIKLLFPLFFGLVPLALFQAYRKQTDDKVAFLSVLFFMSMPVFFRLMPGIRQPIAELFLALCLMLFLDRGKGAARRVLAIIFAFSLVVSHYATSYIYMMYLLATLVLLALGRSRTVSKMWESLVGRLGRFRHTLPVASKATEPANRLLSGRTVTLNYVILFIVFCLAWYIYTSLGSPFISLVRIGDHIHSSLVTEFFASGRDPHILQAMGMAPMRGIEIEWSIARIFQYITQFFIVVGVIALLINQRQTRFYPEYTAMTVISLALIVACIVVPVLAKTISMMRMYHITLFFLAPFFVLGGMAFLHWLGQFFSRRSLHNLVTSASAKVVVIGVLVPYFLFTTGFIFELTGATSTSPQLAFYEGDWNFFTRAEMSASVWLARVWDDNKIYCDSTAAELLYYGRGTEFKTWGLHPETEEVEDGSYIFLRRWNVVDGKVLVSRGESGQSVTYGDLAELELLKSPGVMKIYNSQEAQIWQYRK